MPSPRLIAVPLTLVAAIALGACGSSNDSSSGSSSASTTTAAGYRSPATTGATATTEATTTQAAAGGASTVKLAADSGGALKFDTSELTAKAGNVTIDMANPSPLPHAIAIEGNGVDKKGTTVSTGGHSTVTVELKPGTYAFYCPVPGHEAAGMKGTLKVS